MESTAWRKERPCAPCSHPGEEDTRVPSTSKVIRVVKARHVVASEAVESVSSRRADLMARDLVSSCMIP